MSQSNSSALVLFPGALGDFLVFLPTLVALAERHEQVVLAARRDWTALLAHPRIECWSIEHPVIAALFREDPPDEHVGDVLMRFAVVYSWTGHGADHFPTNLARLVERPPRIYPFRRFAPGEHAVEYYARCARVTPAQPAHIRPHLRVEPSPLCRQLRSFHEPLLAIHPGSGAPRKNWQGFPRLVALWKRATGGRVVAILGPAELERNTCAGEVDFVLESPPLTEVAALLELAPMYVGNDSGVSHLAALLATPGIVLMGPTSSPEHWRPWSDQMSVISASSPCGRCGPEVFCEHLVSAELLLELIEQRRKSRGSKQA
ncbi:MAG: glycosyltransferase family 9 protein [Candidatus Binatia bacterium]|nr:glycosyltransferase family 9 protein [Candidatus Binatia bacterium]